MIIHNVYFWLGKDLSPDERALFEREIGRLPEISYLEGGFAGAPAPTEERPVTDHSFDFALSLHFKSLADHDFYQKECQDHARFVQNCKGLWERVVIYDLLV